ncbi:hypothetical protein, partial [Anaplasma phagocytophilum]|uniref:hypothetical protein n=1 Tax=Anaplasma phagocytophilum TaxID=948 RepID=UPI00201A7693
MGLKTYRVYSRVGDEPRNDRLTHRAVSVYLSWLLEKSISKLKEVVETSEGDANPLLQTALVNVEAAYHDFCLAREDTADDIKQVLVDELVDIIEGLPEDAFLCLTQGVGEADFAVNSTAKSALLLALEELRALAATLDSQADKLGRECIQQSFETLVAPVRSMISTLSQTSLHCLLASRLIESSVKTMKQYAKDPYTNNAE